MQSQGLNQQQELLWCLESGTLTCRTTQSYIAHVACFAFRLDFPVLKVTQAALGTEPMFVGIVKEVFIAIIYSIFIV